MKFSIQSSELVKLVNKTHSVADSRSSMPILGCVLIDAQQSDQVRFSTTDLYLHVLAVGAASVAKPGGIAIPAKSFQSIVKSLPDGEVDVAVDTSKLTVQITMGRGGKKISFKLAGRSAQDFPEGVPVDDNSPAWELPVAALLELIGLTNFSMSTDDTRPHLAGTLVEYDLQAKVITMVTTDGHRLSVGRHPVTTAEATMDLSALIPHRGIIEIKRFLDEIRVSTKKSETEAMVRLQMDKSSRAIRLSYEGSSLTVKLADEQFPPYKKVVPDDDKCARAFSVSAASIVETLRRIGLVAKGNSGNGCQFTLDHETGELRVSAANTFDAQEGHEELDVDVVRTPTNTAEQPPKVTIGFSVKYLLEPIAAMAAQGVSEVTFALNEPLDPIKVYPTHDPEMLVGVVMPMRI